MRWVHRIDPLRVDFIPGNRQKFWLTGGQPPFPVRIVTAFSAREKGHARLPRFEELANFVRVARIAHAEDLQTLAVGELKFPAVRAKDGADAAMLAKELGDFRSVLLHVAAANQTCHHGGITSIIVSSLYVTSLAMIEKARLRL
jgi:hypothetical protein